VHEILDLGTAWYELTNLPFVYAVWALRRGIENKALCRELRETKDFGMETLGLPHRNPRGIRRGFPPGLPRLACPLPSG